MTRFFLALALALLPSAALAKAPTSGRGLVAHINRQLDRWVRPTHACGSAREWLATYYDRGARTANGERFRPDGLTAAHRTLPFGTSLAVCNPKTGRCVTVRVNDRGPATKADIDLSRGAARAIGMHSSIYVCIR